MSGNIGNAQGSGGTALKSSISNLVNSFVLSFASQFRQEILASMSEAFSDIYNLLSRRLGPDFDKDDDDVDFPATNPSFSDSSSPTPIHMPSSQRQQNPPARTPHQRLKKPEGDQLGSEKKSRLPSSVFDFLTRLGSTRIDIPQDVKAAVQQVGEVNQE